MGLEDEEIIYETLKSEQARKSVFEKAKEEDELEKIRKENEPVRERIFKRFEDFIESKNSDNGDFEDFETKQFKHFCKRNPITSLTNEFWAHKFGNPNDVAYYNHQNISLCLIHKGLSYDEIREKIKSKETYHLIARFRGYYTLMGHGYDAYIDFVKYNEIFLNLIEKHDSLGELMFDFLLNFLDYYKGDVEYGYLNDKVVENGKILKGNYPKLKKGMYPAPKWLVYPHLTFNTIGWRMGYGEDYSRNFHSIRINYPVFNELFPQPLNWSFKYSKGFDDYIKDKYSYEGRLAPFAIAWSENGKPKYPLNEIAKDKDLDQLEESEFIFLDEIFDESIFNEEFRVNAEHYESIKSAVSKMKSYFLMDDYDHLKERIWEESKYSVLLNFLYFRIMPEKKLAQKLMDTGDKIILCDSNLVGGDDYYWCVNYNDDKLDGANCLGSAFMELRDEVNRLYKNNDQIDWSYSEFLKEVNPDTFRPYDDEEEDDTIKVDFNNPQSPEYQIYKATYNNTKLYVRDVDLSEELEGKYETGALIREKAFVDMTDKIGQMTTSHRYAIFTNHVGNLSQFEKGTNWNLHTAAAGSKFKILDIYKFKGKTQILLLHLMDGFEEIFIDDNTIDSEYVDSARKVFEESFEKEIIPEVNSPEWLKRCSFPLGMDDNGNLWDLDDE
jgi:predicted NAD-dependent protein-ADP-ribosyltransferase YbiA (DUF1768 family)